MIIYIEENYMSERRETASPHPKYLFSVQSFQDVELNLKQWCSDANLKI